MIVRNDRGGVAVLRMEHGKANALDIELSTGLVQALDDASDAKAVVLTGTGGIFCAGVDLVRLTSGGADYVKTFLPALDGALRALFHFPRPMIAAMNGHAIAGGCILAAACDHRVMARGEGRVGVAELLVGVPFPPLALELMRARLPFSAFQEAVLTGRVYGTEAALARGFVDELVDAPKLLDRAVEVATQMGSVPAKTFDVTKRMIAHPILDAVEATEGAFGDEVSGIWTSGDALGAVKAYVAKTLKK
ncbi:MAG: enoyl-CoA hydratase/isomerase family protein [Planctomycetota bacterium]